MQMLRVLLTCAVAVAPSCISVHLCNGKYYTLLGLKFRAKSINTLNFKVLKNVKLDPDPLPSHQFKIKYDPDFQFYFPVLQKNMIWIPIYIILFCKKNMIRSPIYIILFCIKI